MSAAAGSVDAGELLALMRERGLKITPQRHLLCRLVVEGDHPTAEEIYERAVAQMPTLSLKTVYSTLNELAEIGAVKLFRPDAGSLRVDMQKEPHSHCVCRSCGRILDVAVSGLEVDAAALRRFEFVVEEREVILRGLCGDCRRNIETNGSGNARSASGLEVERRPSPERDKKRGVGQNGRWASALRREDRPGDASPEEGSAGSTEGRRSRWRSTT